MQTKLLLGLGIIIILIFGYTMTKDSGSTPVAQTTNNESAMVEEDSMAESEMMDDVEMSDTKMEDSTMKKDEAMDDSMSEEKMMDDDSNMETHETSMTEPEPAQPKAGAYVTYTPEKVAASDAEHIVLSFSATWCPSCRTLDKNINENLSQIPAGVEIHKVDYDTNVELRKKYGVTTQHTLVEVDASGNMVNKWTGGSDLDSIISKI